MACCECGQVCLYRFAECEVAFGMKVGNGQDFDVTSTSWLVSYSSQSWSICGSILLILYSKATISLLEIDYFYCYLCCFPLYQFYTSWPLNTSLLFVICYFFCFHFNYISIIPWPLNTSDSKFYTGHRKFGTIAVSGPTHFKI